MTKQQATWASAHQWLKDRLNEPDVNEISTKRAIAGLQGLEAIGCNVPSSIIGGNDEYPDVAVEWSNERWTVILEFKDDRHDVQLMVIKDGEALA